MECVEATVTDMATGARGMHCGPLEKLMGSRQWGGEDPCYGVEQLVSSVLAGRVRVQELLPEGTPTPYAAAAVYGRKACLADHLSELYGSADCAI